LPLCAHVRALARLRERDRSRRRLGVLRAAYLALERRVQTNRRSGASIEPRSTTAPNPNSEDDLAQSPVLHDVPAMDYPEHLRTYGLFLGLMKWGTVFCALLLIFMAIFLV
jgi:hypothetical protein